MLLQNFDETLVRFGLERIKRKIDLQITKTGDLAVTRDGDLQVGDTQINALFRLIERWRQSEPTINELFDPMLRAAKTLNDLSQKRERDEGPSLSRNPQAYHEATDAMVESALMSSTLAGSIFVILDNLLQRFRIDLNASSEQWNSCAPAVEGFSIGKIYAAAAANFRHYDEWASVRYPTEQQKVSMAVLCAVLGLPVINQHGFPSIRTNVCGEVLMKVSSGSVDRLHNMTITYAKNLAKFQ